MKAYVCDICGDVIDKPYDARMREFHLVCDHDCLPAPTKEKVKIHLCGACFVELKRIMKQRKIKEKRGKNL